MNTSYKAQASILDDKTNQVAIHAWAKDYSADRIQWRRVFTRTCTGFDRAQEIIDQWQKTKGIADIDLLVTIDTRCVQQ
jgi:hypothetical protein